MATKYLIFAVAFDLAALALGSPYLENFPQRNHVVGRAVARAAAAIRPQPQNWYPGQGLYIRTENGSTVTYHACQTRLFPNERNCAEAYVRGREGEVNVLSEVGTTTPLPPPRDSTPPLPLLPPSQISPTYPPSPYTPPSPSPSNTFHTAHFQSYNLSPSPIPPNPASPSSNNFHPSPPQSPHLPVSPPYSQPSYYPPNSYPSYNQSPSPTPPHANRVQQVQSEQPSEGPFSQQPTHNRHGQRKRNKAGRNAIIIREERRIVNNPGKRMNEERENVQANYIFENWRYYPTTRRFQFVGIVDRKVYDENIQQGHYGDRNTNVPLDCFRYCLETQGQIRQCSRDICHPLRV